MKRAEETLIVQRCCVFAKNLHFNQEFIIERPLQAFIQNVGFSHRFNSLTPKRFEKRICSTKTGCFRRLFPSASIMDKTEENLDLHQGILDNRENDENEPKNLGKGNKDDEGEPENDGLEDEDTIDYDVNDEFDKPDWYTIVESVNKPDLNGGLSSTFLGGETDGFIDLGAVDDSSRRLLTRYSYDSVVDVDIEEGGMLSEDEDNNDMFCGVGLEALIDTKQLVDNLKNNFGVETATHVQLAAIPAIADGRDMVIQSHTGSGKTFAFLLPVLDEINAEAHETQVAIIAPTRELAMQISRECDGLVEGTEIRNLALIGGANPGRQIEKLRRSTPHIVVGTPGRIAELHQNRALRLEHLQTLIIDEVDQCLQEAFLEHVLRVTRAVGEVQKLLISATGDVDSVREFTGTYLHEPVLLRVGGSQKIPKTISHWHYLAPPRLQIDALRKLMYSAPVPQRAIVFVSDPRRADLVVERLYQMKIPAGALRGNAHKLERAEVLKAFRKGLMNLLVTTEVAARGLDVREITHVINLDLPTDGDHYLHRAGRCGRVRQEGHVISITGAENAFVMGKLERELGIEIVRMEPRGGAYREPIDRSRNLKKQKEKAGREPENSSEPTVTKKKKKVKLSKKEKLDGKKKKKESKVKISSGNPNKKRKKADIAQIAAAQGWVGNRNT